VLGVVFAIRIIINKNEKVRRNTKIRHKNMKSRHITDRLAIETIRETIKTTLSSSGPKQYEILIDLFKNSIYHDQQSIFNECVSDGLLSLVKILVLENPKGLLRLVCIHAVHNGHLDILKWARGKGRNPDTDGIGRAQWCGEVCTIASIKGNLDILKWLRGEGRDPDKDGIGRCPWGRKICEDAAYNGQLDILKWLRGEGRDPDTDGIGRACWSYDVYEWAKIKGHLEIINWAKGEGRDPYTDGIGICPFGLTL
jgi:hypothetical protein